MVKTRTTALVTGATGLVGEQLMIQLLSDAGYEKVIAVVRKPLAISHSKLEQLVIDFEDLPTALSGIKADHGFCCLGTTIKVAGSKERQYRIDHDYVTEFAKGCFASGVKRFAVVSSIGADRSSSNFYLRTKGEMEESLKKIPFDGLFVIQPSFLLGHRKEIRTGEKLGIAVMKIVKPLLISGLRKYRGIEAETVAACMIRLVKDAGTGIKTIQYDAIIK